MNPGRHAADDQSFVRSAGGAATRGIILIVVATVIGVVLIATAVDDNEDVVTVADTAATTTTVAGDSTGDTAATTAPAVSDTTVATTAPATQNTTATSAAPTTDTSVKIFDPRANSLVSVQVVNTTKVGGAAGRMKDTLKAQGYVTLDATNSSAGVLEVTKVHHVNGYLLEAQKLAETLGLDLSASVFSMPANAGSTIENYLEPQVLVLLGTDLAS